MRWLNWVRSRLGLTDTSDPIDVEAVVASGLRDKTSAQDALSKLRSERKRLERKQRALTRKSGQPGTRAVRAGSRLDSHLGSYQMSQELQHAHSADQNPGRDEQVTEVERQIKRVDDGIAQLRYRF